MYPSGGQMSSAYYDPRAGFTPPCCGGHGYSYNNYYYPTVPVTPYQHLYPSPHPYVAPHPVMQPYCHPHHPHYHTMPGTPAPAPAPANSYVANEACTPIQQQQQQSVWRPVVVPPSSCCCGHSNPASYYGYDAKVSNVNENGDVKKMEDASSRPVLLSGGSNSLQPQLYWIPPQYVSNLKQQGADKVHQDEKTGGQMIPLDLDKLTSLLNKESNKHVTAGVRKDLPFILMPSNSDKSRESTAKNRICEIEEKPFIFNNNAGTLKLLGNGDVASTVPHEPGKTSEPRNARNDSIGQVIQTQNDKVRVKDIPVKQADESSEKKPSTNAARSRSVSPTKKSKLPPVCLRVDPLPRKKNANGTPKPPGSPSHEGDSQQTAQTGIVVEDLKSEKKEVSESKTAQHITDNAKHVEMVEASSKESLKDNPVLDETGNVKNKRENINDGKLTDSKTPAGLEESNEVKVRAKISEETAAVRIQTAYRGYEERKWHSLQKLKQIAKVREQISIIKDRIQALENNADMNKDEFEKQRLVLGETIMSHLLTLDTIQGLHPSIRDVRKSVARELISLQEKLDLFHAQKFGLKGQETNHENKDAAAGNREVKEVQPCSEEERDSSNVINTGDVQEAKRQENESQNMTKAIDGSVDKREDLIESIYAALNPEEICAENSQLRGQGEAILNISAGDEADLKLMSSPDQVEAIGKEITEDIILEEQREGGNKSSVAEFVSEHDSKAIENAPEEVKDSNPVSCDTVSAADGNDEQVSKSGEECGETIERVEKQPKQWAVQCESKILDEQETIAVSTCATMFVSSDEKPEQASEILLSGDAASEKSEVLTPEVAEIESGKGNEKSAAPFEDDDGISIDEHETPRLSNVSRTSDSIVLAEENDKLRETVRKLLESEKDQLAVITTLNERLRNLEKKMKTKRNRKVKLHKSSHKNHETYDQNMPMFTM